MKIANSGSVLDTNNNNTDSLEFGIGDVSTIIDILRNRLYSNPIRTLTQEYLCNGRDSHRDAGNPQTPLRVTLPTKLDSVLKIRDFGTGLSPDRIKDVFVLYGSSTKRKDNVQTGGFGIGAKSAWAYTDSFVVASHHDGKCRTYIAHTGKNSNGTLELISDVDSTEPNGVEIQIPVKESDIEQFILAVYRCTYFWDVKPELKGITNIEIPASWLAGSDNILHKKDNWFLVEKNDLIKRLFDSYNQDIYVLIDKIPYSINKFARECPEVEKLKATSYAPHMSFIEVDNGVLEVSATRESISDKEDGKQKVNQICEEARKSLYACVKEQCAKNFEDISSYVSFYFKLKTTFNFSALPNSLDFTFSKSGCSYSLVDGKIKSTNFDGCNVTRYNIKHQKTRRILNRVGNVEIHYGEEKSGFVLMNDDKNGRPVPEYVFKEKIKKLFVQDESLRFVYVISNYTTEQKSNFKDHFGSIFITDIQVDKPAYKAKKFAGTITVRYLSVSDQHRSKLESDTKEDTTLETIETSPNNYISIPFSSDAIYDFDSLVFVENIKFLIQHGKYKIIKLSKRDYDAVNTLDNVMEYSSVAESISDHVEIGDKVIEDFVFKQANNAFEPLRKMSNQIKCDKISEYFRIKSQIPADNKRLSTNIPDRILAMYPFYSKVSDSVKKLAKLEAEITEKYPLIKQLSYITGGYYGSSGDKQKELLEFVFYLNAKHCKATS